jgi:hypothetical protein
VKPADGLTIRSFRVVFELERRIHKIDRWRLPVPYGVPLRGVAYWALALLGLIALGSLPLAKTVVGLMPPPVRFALLPVAVAYALTQIHVDGRPAHAALRAWIRFRTAPSRIGAFRRVRAPGSVVRLGGVAVVYDERSARYRPAVVEGPATVLLRYPLRGWTPSKRRRNELHVRPIAGALLFVGKQVQLGAGQRLVVHE